MQVHAPAVGCNDEDHIRNGPDANRGEIKHWVTKEGSEPWAGWLSQQIRTDARILHTEDFKAQLRVLTGLMV